MKQRVISALVGLVLLLGILTFFNTIYFDVIVLIAYGIALYEIFKAFKEKNTVLVSAMLAMAGLYFIIPSLHSNIPLIILAAVEMFIYAAIMVFGFKNLDFKNVSSNLMFGIYVLVGFSSVPYMKQLLPYDSYGYDSLFLFVLCLVIAWGSDVFAYFAGYLFGKNKLAPNLSPKKTVEGFFGGLFGSALLALALLFLYVANKANMERTNISYAVSAKSICFLVIFAVVCGSITVIGDLFASAIKRQIGIKDYGNIMPGHGGILDRFDSVIVLSPIICALAYYVSQLGGVFSV